jgi:hypothetical protein
MGSLVLTVRRDVRREVWTPTRKSHKMILTNKNDFFLLTNGSSMRFSVVAVVHKGKL